MNSIYIDYIAEKMQVASWRVSHCIELFDEGATIPFISRYRKERTGALDEMQVAEIKHYHLYFDELEKRKATILKSISEQGKLTDELQQSIEAQVDAQALEDIYLPYKPKKRTRAMIAKEKGLEPLAKAIINAEISDAVQFAGKFVSDKVGSVDEALEGARDIIAEKVSETPQVRAQLRDLYTKWGTVSSRLVKGKEEDEQALKYRNYFEFSEKLDRIPPHRLLAILRASNEGVLSLKIDVNEDHAIERISKKTYPSRHASASVRQQLDEAIRDSYKRLLHPSIENESLKIAKEKADVESIKVFGENLRQLLLAPPVGQKRTMALDPGFRTGCKLVCLDAQGNLLCNDTIYPHPPVNERIASMNKVLDLVDKYKIEVIAIGNGTAGRETENFIKRIGLPEFVQVFSVSEDGASIYSASPVAIEEFPEYDVTVRGAVSIGRRLMDPLAELVKIDPKSIGVGQYQHDVDQNLLKETLDNTVESCVNSVGVNLNTASKHLLSYVSGIGPALAASIVDYRTENGTFSSRKQLTKVKRLGDKAFEQCAGFLRIPGAANPLDNSAVHPESYHIVEKMASDLGCKVTELIGNEQLIAKIDLKKYVTSDVGMDTLTDIKKELAKPGSDPRNEIQTFSFSEEISTIEDVRVGMILPGIVTNITDFGAFVDIGIKQNGLIHVSRMGSKFVTKPADILKIHQHVNVKVVDVDLQRQRIGLSLNF
ncbi:MAG: RNA-binding transcriptional accessory protein [Bacteroidales bacterium]|nr:RNA-binding transcriptional accessory protein [Bacteroidales bacterium]